MDSLKGTLTPMKVLNGTLNGGIAYGTFNYNELENKPSVNGTELVGNVNINIPTKTSDLTNDSGFITSVDVPTKTSDLTNDSGFITSADIPTKTSELTNDSGFITSADIPTIPTNTSQLNNDSGFLTINTTPVRSVNSLTGDVNLFIPNATSQLTNDTGFITGVDVPVKSVNNQTGDVELTSDNIPYDSENSIADMFSSLINYQEYNFTNFMVNLYNQINYVSGTTEFKIIKIGKIGIINCRFTTSSAIDSGAGNIPNVPETKNNTEFRGSISTKDNKSGFIQYTGNTILIRCDASSIVFEGQLVFAIK